MPNNLYAKVSGLQTVKKSTIVFWRVFARFFPRSVHCAGHMRAGWPEVPGVVEQITRIQVGGLRSQQCFWYKELAIVKV